MAASHHAARRLVAAPYRSGGQAQYVPRSVPEPLGERFAATREWALHRLGEPLTLDVLARHAGVSAGRSRGSVEQIAAVNDLTEPATLARLLAYDSTAGRLGTEGLNRGRVGKP